MSVSKYIYHHRQPTVEGCMAVSKRRSTPVGFPRVHTHLYRPPLHIREAKSARTIDGEQRWQ